MAREKKSVCWTICYALVDPKYEDGFWTATGFAYGKTKEDAKANFLRDYHEHPEDFYGATRKTEIQIVNVVKGFSC